MFGDVLKRRIPELSKTIDTRSNVSNAFWVVLKDIAIEELKEYNDWVDSDSAIAAYYNILSANENYIPDFKKASCLSNGQKKYRVANRNMWSSNAWHVTGLENCISLKNYQRLNGRGFKRIYKYIKDE